MATPRKPPETHKPRGRPLTDPSGKQVPVTARVYQRQLDAIREQYGSFHAWVKAHADREFPVPNRAP
jgi:hypothetical protein